MAASSDRRQYHQLVHAIRLPGEYPNRGADYLNSAEICEILPTARGAMHMEHKPSNDLQHYSLYIDGCWIDAISGGHMPVNEPARGAPMAYIANGAAEDVDLAVQAARAAFDHGPWPHTPPHERARILHTIADALEERSAELAEIESRNLGVPLRKSSFVDVPMAVEHFRTFAELARKHPYEPLPWIDMP